jgi:ferric-chelate reductase
MGGLKGWGEVHPFTIASAADGEGIELLIKEGGDWTRQLASFAKAGNQFDLESGGMGKPRPLQLLKGLGSGRSVNVLVEGPYGGPCHSVVSSYSAALIVCGGSGISYGIALLSEIVRDAEDGKARVRVGEMVWVVRDPGIFCIRSHIDFELTQDLHPIASLAPVLPTLTSLLARASEVPGLSIQVTVYYTKAQAPNSTPFDFNRSPQQAHYFKSSEKPSPLLTRNGSNSSQKSLTLPPHLSLHPSRPSIPSHLTSLIQLTRSLKNGAGSHGVVIACCGTDGLREDVKNAERGVERLARNQVGGVEVLDEGFSW